MDMSTIPEGQATMHSADPGSKSRSLGSENTLILTGNANISYLDKTEGGGEIHKAPLCGGYSPVTIIVL